jgi:hypothetical protein
MIEEPWGIEQRDFIGVDRILWESDYPHADTPWPYTQQQVAEVFKRVSDSDVQAITHTNAEKLFKWKIASPDLVAPHVAELKKALADSSLGAGARVAREQSEALAK